MNNKRAVVWPAKHKIFGIEVSATTYEEALSLIIMAARQGISAIVDHMPVHGLIETSRDSYLKSIINSFNIVAPDGQPVRWALNLLYNTKLPDRVCGPELMLKLCRRAVESDVGIYLYGSKPHVIEKLRVNLIRQFPSLQVVGYESPPFRPLTQEEDKVMVERINRSGAGIVFIGLGCPKQEVFAHEHRNIINAVQVCVGAAFDFHAGTIKRAPVWMQRNGLEWLFRLIKEPRRLWRRYLVTNTIFLLKLLLQLSGLKKF